MSNQKRAEEMSEFFNVRADGYDDHMRGLPFFEGFYSIIPEPIEATNEPIQILDLGCGTGLELAGVFEKAPNCQITGIDLSEKMLDELLKKYADYTEQIQLIQGSYLEVPFGEKRYDYAISSQTMHHFLPEEKVKLYEKIKNSLKSGGMYIEGDFMVSKEDAAKFMQAYETKLKELDGPKELYHLDIPFTLELQQELLVQAGFANVEVSFHQEDAVVMVATTA